MKLKIISKEEYKSFAMKSPYISIYQLPEWGELKKITNWNYYLLGLYDKNNLVGVTMLLEKRMPFKKSLFYSPRGYLFDVSNYDLLKEFHNNIIEFVKKHNGFLFKIDPNVIYNIRDKEGNLVKTVGDKIYNNFINLKYKHIGWTENFETLQPRFLCRFKLSEDYDKTLNSFTKNTRKNINKTLNNGVCIKNINSDDIELFTNLLKKSGSKNNFIIRPSYYYKKMYDLMNDYIKLYIVYIDTDIYFNLIKKEIDSVNLELVNFYEQIKKINVGNKVKKRENELNNKLNKLNNELNYAKKLKEEQKIINIGTLMSVFIGNEGITFMSGIDPLYKDFNPKYAFYNAHIIDSLKLKKEYVNFYGISGNIDKNNPYYHIYEIKKGFNPEIVELIGEFDFIINPFYYYIYKLSLKFYKIIKKIRN